MCVCVYLGVFLCACLVECVFVCVCVWVPLCEHVSVCLGVYVCDYVHTRTRTLFFTLSRQSNEQTLIQKLSPTLHCVWVCVDVTCVCGAGGIFEVVWICLKVYAQVPVHKKN